MAKQKNQSDNSSFESQLQKLEELVAKLETGEVPLEQSLVFFEEGVNLYRSCKKRMQQVEIKIQKLTESMREESMEESE